jgi:hypothetical protein
MRVDSVLAPLSAAAEICPHCCHITADYKRVRCMRWPMTGYQRWFSNDSYPFVPNTQSGGTIEATTHKAAWS